MTQKNMIATKINVARNLLIHGEFDVLCKKMALFVFWRSQKALNSIRLRLFVPQILKKLNQNLIKNEASGFEFQDSAISIVIVNFNQSHYLTTAIESVLNQTSLPRELIIVSSGDQGEYELACGMVPINPSIPMIVVWCSSNPAGMNRNLGAKIASGKYILFLDADDYLRPNCVDVLEGNSRYKDSSIIGIDCIYLPTRKQNWPNTRVTNKSLRWSNQLSVTSLIPREKFVAIDGFRDSKYEYLHLPEDWDLWWRISNTHPCIYNLREPLFYYRQHPNSQTAINRGLEIETVNFWRQAVSGSGYSYLWKNETSKAIKIIEFLPIAGSNKMKYTYYFLDKLVESDDLSTRLAAILDRLEGNLVVVYASGVASFAAGLEEVDSRLSLLNAADSFPSLYIFVNWLNIKLKENDFEIDEQSTILRKIIIAVNSKLREDMG